MKPYPAYKNPSLPWVERIPAGWEALPNIALFDERIERGFITEELLSVTQDRGIIKQSELEEKKDSSNEDKSAYKRVRVGDIAYNKMRMWQGAVGHSPFAGIVSPAYIVLKPKRRINPRYYHYLFRTPAYTRESYRNSYGICDDQLSLRFFNFKRMQSIIPPVAEQNAIVAFLEAKERDIQTFIANKRRMIELLKEQKTALINRAVTRGLNPKAALKPSGISWIGGNPKHWHEKPAKFFFREIDERSEGGREELLSVSHITGVTPRKEKEITMFMAESYEGFKMCQPGDLVINIMWAWMGALGVSRHSGIVSSAYGVYRLRNSAMFESDYLDHLLRANPYTADYHCRSTGIRSSRLRMYSDDFFKVPILRPPIPEQRQIVDYIRAESAQTDRAVTTAEHEIVLMEEYRTTLIAAAVTGKIDVRSYQ